MKSAFDPYYKWLGIPPDCQPPHHYRLLGIQLFEADPDVIQAAADQRMMHLRGYQTGKHSEWSQRLLNEVAAAKVCLLNAAKKAAYDRQLRESLESSQPSAHAIPPDASSSAPPTCVPDELADFPEVRLSTSMRRAKQLPIGAIVVGLTTLIGALVIGAAYWALEPSGTPVVVQPKPPEQLRMPRQVAKQPAPVQPLRPAAVVPNNPPPVVVAPPQPPKNANNAEPPIEIAPPPERRAVEPPIKAQGGAMKIARDHYKDELAKAKTAEKKRDLATKVFGQAKATAGNDNATFALFRLTCEIAAQASDVPTAFAAIDELAKRFQVDAVVRKTELLSTMAEDARTPIQHAMVAEHAVRLMTEVAADEEFEQAADIARLAIVEGGQCHDIKFASLTKLARAWLKEYEQSAVVVKEAKIAEGTLAKTPDDPDANSIVGIYYCIIRKDWARGFRYLAKGSDPDLKTLAELEQKSQPHTPEEHAALADAWWNASRNAKGAKRAAMVRRAAFWGERAYNGLGTGPDKAKLEKRLLEIAKSEPASPAGILDSHPSVSVVPTVPIKKAFSLLISPDKLVGWETANCQFRYSKGVIELQASGDMYCPIVAKNATISTRVQCQPNVYVRLMIRKSNKGCYVARISNGAIEIVRQKPGTGDVSLAKMTLPRVKNQNSQLVVLGFSAVDDVLTVFVNGTGVLKAVDTTLTQGSVGIGASSSDGVSFANVKMHIPNKASFVADERKLGN